MAGRYIGPHGRGIENDFESQPGVTTLNTFTGTVQIVNGVNTTVSSPQPGWIQIDAAGGSGELIVIKTLSEAQDLVTNSTLVPGQLYMITGVDSQLYGGTDILIRAIETNEFDTCGDGIFYNPIYNKSLNTYGVWNMFITMSWTNTGEINFEMGNLITSNNGATGNYILPGVLEYLSGDWSIATTVSTPPDRHGRQATADVNTIVYSTYNIGDTVIWGGKVWQNVNGNLGSAISKYQLDSEWTEVSVSTPGFYQKVVCPIEYDFTNDIIIYRKEIESGNEVRTTLTTNLELEVFQGTNDPINPIKDFQWGNPIDNPAGKGVSGNSIINSHFDCLNAIGTDIENNLIRESYVGNYIGNNNIFLMSRIANNKLTIHSSLINNYFVASDFEFNSVIGDVKQNEFKGAGIISNIINGGSLIQNSVISGAIISNHLSNTSFINGNIFINGGIIYNNYLVNNSSIINNILTSGNITGNILSADASIANNAVNNFSILNNNLITQNSGLLSNTDIDIVGINSMGALKLGSPGSGTPPTQMLDVFGNITFTGALMANNLSGNVGDVLVSQGDNVAPVWSGGYLWSTTGNTGTNASINFIGTTDAQDLVFKVNNVTMGRLCQTTAGGAENYSIAFGYNSLLLQTDAAAVVAIGGSSLVSATNITQTVAIGRGALQSALSGLNNVGIGDLVMSGASGNLTYNIAIGATALNALTGSQGNIGIGYGAGAGITSGEFNIFIGHANGGITDITGNNNIIMGNTLALQDPAGSNQLNIQNIIFGAGNSGSNTTVSTGNIGIGVRFPLSTALLDLTSTTKGFLPPRMTKAQRNAISSPATGLVIYQTDNTPGIRAYNGTNWIRYTETVD